MPHASHCFFSMAGLIAVQLCARLPSPTSAAVATMIAADDGSSAADRDHDRDWNDRDYRDRPS